MNKSVYLLILLLFFSLGLAVAGNDATPLNGKEVKQLVKGNTAEGEKIRVQTGSMFLTVHIPFETYFKPDGGILEKSHGGGQSDVLLAHGKWWVKKGKLCFQYFDSLRDTGKKCKKVVSTGDGSYELQDKNGKATHRWHRVVPGNPHGLE
jgi:hypothetical protein